MAHGDNWELREQIATCTRLLVMQEIMDFSGHVSARIPGSDRILIQPRDTSRAALTADDVLLVDLNNNVLEGEGPAPSETALHTCVYRARPDVTSVCHGHPTMSTLFTTVDRPFPAVRNFAYTFLWNAIFAVVFYVINAASIGRLPSWRAFQLILLVANVIGYTIHLVYILGTAVGLERAAPSTPACSATSFRSPSRRSRSCEQAMARTHIARARSGSTTCRRAARPALSSSATRGSRPRASSARRRGGAARRAGPPQCPCTSSPRVAAPGTGLECGPSARRARA